MRNPIVLYGTTAVEPVIAKFGARLSQLDPPYSLLYVGQDGCMSVGVIAKKVAVSGSAEFYYVDSDGSDRTDTCSLSSVGATRPDVALTDVFWETCPRSLDDPTVRAASFSAQDATPSLVDFHGPTQAAVFAVPRANFSTTYLSLEQTRDIVICGADGLIYPFVHPTQILAYNTTAGGDKGMQQMTFACLGLSGVSQCSLTCNPRALWNADVASLLEESTDPGSAIGYLSNEVYDQHRSTLKSLALQGPGQGKAYYPDSDSTSRDRRMVRDGHYMAQGPLHMIAYAGPDNVPTLPGAQRFINWMLQKPGMPGEAPLPFNIIDVFAATGVVPACAMHVIRYTDGGPFAPYHDPQPCGCYFESKTTGVAVPCGCQPCASQAECSSSQVCSYGFCE